MKSIDLSIIIVSYNTWQITANCIKSVLKSLQNSPINYEIIVVDNASSDRSVEVIKSLKLRVKNFRLIESKTNLGFGRGNNLGVKHARGECLLFLNSDTLVQRDSIQELFNFFKQQQSFKFLGGKLLNKDLSPQPSCGPFYSLPIIFSALFLRGDYWGLTRRSPKKTREVDWVSGACIMTKKEYFTELGGFDEEIFMYMEEIDLLYRARKLGYKTGFYPNAEFIHLGSASSGGRTYPILQVYKGFRYFYNKHYGKTAQLLLEFLLKLKALIALGIGKLSKNTYLVETYAKAYKMDR